MFSIIITTHYKIILCKHLNIFHINVNKNIYPSIGRIRTKNKKILHFIPWHKRHKIILWHFISVTHGWKRNSFQFSSAWCVKVILYIRVTKIVYVQIRNILICSFSWICIGDSFEHMHKMYSLRKWTPQRSSLLNSSSNILNYKLCIRHKITFLVVIRGLSKFRMQIFFKIYCKWQDRILSSKTEWLCQQNAFKIELWIKVRKKSFRSF